MNPPQLRLTTGPSLMMLICSFFCNISTAGTDLIYVSYGDRRGYTHPDIIENFDSTTLADQGAFSSSTLSLPDSLAFGPDGNLYAVNYGNSTISRFTRAGVGSVFASTAIGPTGLVFDKAGNLYIANYWASNIQKFTPEGVGSVFATNGIIYPTGLAIDSIGNIYVANGGNLTIQKFTSQGIASIFAQTPEVNRPFGGLACDAFDNVYLGCQASNNPGILKFTPNGVRSVFHTSLGLPASFAFDSEGNIYAANYSDDTIEKLSPVGDLLASVSTLTRTSQPSPWGIAIRLPCQITCPTNFIVCADSGQCGAIVHFASTVTNCAGLVIESGPPSGSFFPIGTNLVVCTAKDSNGQVEESCKFEVVVLDCEPPTLTCPTNVTVEWTGTDGAPVLFNGHATDLCSGEVALSCVPASGSIFPVGTNIVICNAIDNSGNSGQCSFTVTVEGGKTVKENILAEIISVNGQRPRRTRRLELAIARLSESLKTNFWIDPIHLEAATGKKTFIAESRAVIHLHILKKHKGETIDALLQDWIDRLVRVDRLLAVLQIEEAIQAGASWEQLAMAFKQISAGDKVKLQWVAILYYEHAWKEAIRLIKRLPPQ